MKDYLKIDKYLAELDSDVYSQPLDEVHRNQTRAVFYTWISYLAQSKKVKTAIDIGCGQGVAFEYFEMFKINFVAITLGEDFEYCKANLGRQNVFEMDMHFLDFPDENFDLVYARHILEHSAMPLLALMEWHRVAKQYAVIVVPHHEHVIQGGKNHYYMLNPIQWGVLFKRAGWELEKEDYCDPSEFRFLLKKVKRVPMV